MKKKKEESLEDQVQRLANYILNNCEGYPNANEGAVDCAIRIIKSRSLEPNKELTPEQAEKWLKSVTKKPTEDDIKWAKDIISHLPHQGTSKTECWDIYLTEMGIGLKERNLILKRLTKELGKEVNAAPNRIQIAENMSKECVDKIVSSEWVEIKNKRMVELTIRNTMSDYHSSLSHLSKESVSDRWNLTEKEKEFINNYLDRDNSRERLSTKEIGIKQGLDYDELERKFDKFLDKESPESFRKWLNEERNKELGKKEED